MRVADRLALREGEWRELDALLRRIESPRTALREADLKARTGSGVVWLDDDGHATREHELAGSARPSKRLTTAEVVRLGELYRSACADLMLAEAHDLPRETVAFLHSLVGRAHNALYRARGFNFAQWAGVLFHEVPRTLRSDRMFWLSAALFWGVFLACLALAAARPEFAEAVVSQPMLDQMEEMYARPLAERSDRSDSLMTGFYIQHNASIGLQCYAWGLTLGIGTIYTLVSNAAILGAVFGHMLRTPHAANFYEFVTAHGPFELTAIVMSGGAGLRLGRGLIVTNGFTRLASLRQAAVESRAIVGAAVVLFILAAFLEGFVSASPLPYWIKAGIATLSAGLLLFYLLAGGRQPTRKSPVAKA